MKKIFSYCSMVFLLAGTVATGAVTVTVDAGKTLTTMPDELFGQNWNTYEKSGDGLDETYNATVKVMGTTQMRVPGGGYADMRIWDNVDCDGKDSSWLLGHEAMIRFTKASGTQMQPIVNFSGHWCGKEHGHEAAVQKAVEWLKYLNIDPGIHRADYWEIGNEIYGQGETGHTSDDFKGGEDYGRRFIDFYKAMKAQDPSVKLGAVVQHDHLPWTNGVLSSLKAGGIIPDFVANHAYPVWIPVPGREQKNAPNWDKTLYASSQVVDRRILENVDEAARITRILNTAVEKHLGGQYVGKLDYWMTEYRSVLEYKYIEWVDALFNAQFLLEMGRLGWKGANIWALKNGYNTKTQADFGLLRTGVNSESPDDNPKNSPRPTWYIFPYLSKVFGRHLVETSDDDALLRSWASRDLRGNLTVFLVNNSPTAENAVTVNLKGFDAGSKSELWLMQGAGFTHDLVDEPILQLTDIQVNGKIRPDPLSLPGPSRPLATGSKFQLQLPAASMALIRIPSSGNQGTVPAPAINEEPVELLRARAHARAGRVREAVASYKAALKARPKLAVAWSEMGELYKKAGYNDHAQICFDHARKLHGE